MIRTLKRVRVKILNTLRLLVERLGYLKRYVVKPDLPVNADGKVYVNLGAGRNTSQEFINVDTRPMPHTHYVHVVEDLPMFPSKSVDLLYASHILEHVPRGAVVKTLREWRRVLRSGGVLRFGVPDFDRLIEVYTASGRNVDAIVNQLMGQDAPYDDHHTIWNYAYAQRILETAGFREVRLWDPASADHHSFGDKTMATIKVGDREEPISLNIEAVR